jgi:dGTPase
MFEQSGHAVAPAVRRDWELFEGNAQGFRRAARADNPRTGYLRLTHATLGAMIKYPWDSADQRAEAKGKFNVFSTEKHLFEAMARDTGLYQGGGGVARHPLSFLAEAADDICYRVLDLEDAVDMGILIEGEVRQVFLELLRVEDQHQPLAMLRGQVIRVLVEACWGVFEADYGAIMAGQRDADLKSAIPAEQSDALGSIDERYAAIFAHRTKVATELGAYQTLGRIIETLTEATAELAKVASYDEVDFLTQRRLDLAWGEAYARANEAAAYEWWLHQVMDYVAGLTDNYARQLSREIAGV